MWPKDTYGAPTNSTLFRQDAIIILKEKYPDLSEDEINSYFDIIMEESKTFKADFVQEVYYPDLTKALRERVSDYINFRKLNYDNI